MHEKTVMPLGAAAGKQIAPKGTNESANERPLHTNYATAQSGNDRPASNVNNLLASASATSEMPQLPYSEAEEKAVLGMMLCSQTICSEMIAILDENCFFHPKTREIFSVICKLDTAGKSIDSLSVASSLSVDPSREGEFYAYLLELEPAGHLSILSAQTHAETLMNLARRRALMMAGTVLARYAADTNTPIEDVIDEVYQLVDDAAISDAPEEHDMATLLDQVIKEALERSNNPGAIVGISSGVDALDKVTYGFLPGDDVVVGARTSIGKTSFATKIAFGAAESGAKVIFFSLEMTAKEISTRLLSQCAGIAGEDIQLGNLSADQKDRMEEAKGAIKSLDINVYDAGGLTPAKVKALSRRALRGCERGIIIIDYLQLMMPSDVSARGRGLYESVTAVSQEIKRMAKELGVPVIVLSQLRRPADGRVTAPVLSDLRDSGSIEQDADIVVLLDRSMTQAEIDSKKRPGAGEMVIDIAKNRRGRMTSFVASYDAATTDISE